MGLGFARRQANTGTWAQLMWPRARQSRVRTSVYRDGSSDKVAEQIRRVQRRQQETTEQCIGVCTAVGGWRRRLACRLSCSDRAGGARASRGLRIVPGLPTNGSLACPSRLFPRNSLLSNLLENYPNAVAYVSSPLCCPTLGIRPRYWSLPRRPPALSPPMLHSEGAKTTRTRLGAPCSISCK